MVSSPLGVWGGAPPQGLGRSSKSKCFSTCEQVSKYILYKRKLVAYRIERQWWCKKHGNKICLEWDWVNELGLYLAQASACTILECTECAKYRPSYFTWSHLVSVLFTPTLSFNSICHQLSCYLFHKFFFASLHGHRVFTWSSRLYMVIASLHGRSQSPKFGWRWGW